MLVEVSSHITEWILNTIPETGVWLGVSVLLANAITMFAPTQLENKEGKMWKTALNLGLKVLNMVALNVLKNKNAK